MFVVNKHWNCFHFLHTCISKHQIYIRARSISVFAEIVFWQALLFNVFWRRNVQWNCFLRGVIGFPNSISRAPSMLQECSQLLRLKFSFKLQSSLRQVFWYLLTFLNLIGLCQLWFSGGIRVNSCKKMNPYQT